MRAFIAIELPKEIKDILAKLQEKLKSADADVKWVEPQNIHLTLKFLGEIDEKKAEKIKQILQELVRDKKAFSLRLSTLGAFPKLNYPRVIWVGIEEGKAIVKEVAQTLEEKIAKLGIPKEERPFSGHLTLGRVRSGLNRIKLTQSLEGLRDELKKENLTLKVTKITLFQSTLTPKGPTYTSLQEANLESNYL